MKLIEIAECLIEKIKKDYNGDVSLVHIHGSYFYDDTHDLSDLDLYLVPKTKRGFNLGQTFILNGIGCDFWALSWERLERIANHEEKFESLITDGKVLYYHSENDLERFNKLKIKALDHTDNDNRGKEAIYPLYRDYFNIVNSNSITEVRKAVIGIIYSVSKILAQINHSPIKRGRRHLKAEIMAMKKVPLDFEKIYDQLFIEKDIAKDKESLYTLIRNTEKMFSDNPEGRFTDNFSGFYEEMIQSYNKIYHACDTGDIYTPLFASVELSSEIEELFQKSNCSYLLPDMVGAYDPENLGKIKLMAQKHQEEFVRILKENGVPIRSFSDINELKQFLEKI